MAVFYKYQYTNKRKNIHPCHTGCFFILVRLKMTKVPGPEEILTLRTFLMGFIM